MGNGRDLLEGVGGAGKKKKKKDDGWERWGEMVEMSPPLKGMTSELEGQRPTWGGEQSAESAPFEKKGRGGGADVQAALDLLQNR